MQHGAQTQKERQTQKEMHRMHAPEVQAKAGGAKVCYQTLPHHPAVFQPLTGNGRDRLPPVLVFHHWVPVSCPVLLFQDAPRIGLLGQCWKNRNLGSAHLQQNNLADAEQVLQESLNIKRQLAPDMIVADTLNNLGNCANLHGELEASLIHHEEALEDIRTKSGRPADKINALFNIGPSPTACTEHTNYRPPGNV
jgi:tetratricopeptide (TPR) repeat protein